MKIENDILETMAALGGSALGAILVLIAVGFALALLLTSGGVFNKSVRALAVERAEALQPWKIGSAVTAIVLGSVLKVTAVAAVVYLLFGATRAVIKWARLKAGTIHAKRGVFPVIELEEGYLYDPNRDNAGVHPIITVAALDVQKASALSHAEGLKNDLRLAGGRAPTDTSQALSQSDTWLPEMIRLAEVAGSPSLRALTLGISEAGPVRASLHELMHVLTVGASGFGKSAFLRALVWQLAQVREPVDVVAIDVNGSEFNVIRDWERLLYPVARTTKAAIATLHEVRKEIERRKGLYEQYPTAYDLPSYNTQAQESLSPVVILADEATNLLNQDGVGEPLREVTQTARQYGVYLLLAGQSAKHSVIDTQTRDNFSTRLCFHASPSSYRTVFGESVDDVTVKGRAWAQLTGQTLQQIQCPYVTREEVQSVVETGAPAHVIDVDAMEIEQAQVIEDDPDLSDEARIRLLARQGLSQSAIEQRVYGFTGGSAYRRVKDVLG
jgi:DNA segregation ATPase FtsK/SpoIIIE-like protein